MPNALQFSFRVGLAEVGPPGWRFASAPARAALRLALVAFCLEEKDKDLALGIGADGEALAPLSIKTRETRRSAMGAADPNAPPLVPAHGLSRARSLLTGKPIGPDAAVFYWRHDRRTGASWGKVLDYHRRGDGPFPARDVIGLSPARRAIVRARLAAWWSLYLAGAVPVPVAAPPQALPDPAPPFLTKAVPAYVPKYPELAVAKAPKHVSQVEINGRVFTFGPALGGKASAAGLKRAIAHGKFSGFTKYDPQTGLPLPKGPSPTQPPPVAPKSGGPAPSPAPSSAVATLVKPKPKPKPTAPRPTKPKAVLSTKPGPFPSDPDSLRFVRPLGGSTGAELVEDADGNRFVRKRGGNPGHLREEATADALYRALGLDVPDSRLYERAGAPPVKLARFAEGAVPLGELERTDPARYQAAVRKAREGFAADAVLGNWDVIGLNQDNVLVTPDGRVLRVDNGGALRYRAQGQPKGSGWGGLVAELHSLRDAHVNPSAANVFGPLTNAEVRTKAKALARKRAKLLAAAPEGLRADLAARLDDIGAWAAKKPPSLPKNFRPPGPGDFREFERFADADEWGKGAFREWADSLGLAEKEKISYYSSEGYREMNEKVRSTAKTAREGRVVAAVDPDIKLLAGALEGGRTREQLVAWRGIKDFRDLGIRGVVDLEPGVVIEEAAFASTSLLKEVGRSRAAIGKRPVLLKVFISADAPAGYVNATGEFSAVPHEAELLLPPGRGVWRVFRGPSPEDRVPEAWVQWVKQ